MRKVFLDQFALFLLYFVHKVIIDSCASPTWFWMDLEKFLEPFLILMVCACARCHLDLHVSFIGMMHVCSPSEPVILRFNHIPTLKTTCCTIETPRQNQLLKLPRHLLSKWCKKKKTDPYRWMIHLSVNDQNLSSMKKKSFHLTHMILFHGEH